MYFNEILRFAAQHCSVYIYMAKNNGKKLIFFVVFSYFVYPLFQKIEDCIYTVRECAGDKHIVSTLNFHII